MRRLLVWLVVAAVSGSLAAGCAQLCGTGKSAKPTTAAPASKAPAK